MKLWSPILFAATMLVSVPGFGAEPAGEIGLIEIDGVIGPTTVSYISRAIDEANSRNDRCLIIQLNTPGGVLGSTFEIVERLFASPVPTIVYVAPSGATAGSAGTFITLAADVAAMAPHAAIGAAHPVTVGSDGNIQKPDEVVNKKLESIATTKMKSITDKRNRNEKWAVSAVLESASATAEEALDLKVIDLIAKDLPELLEKLEGREVNGKALRTAGAEIHKIPMTVRERILEMFWQPPVVFILMLVAIYGIIGEINNPGAIFPGVVGAIALILFLYLSTVLPVNIAGVALVLLAVVLFVIDIYAPTHGVLTVGGIVSFFLGAVMLFNHAGPAFHLSLAWIIPATVTTALFFLFVVGAGLRAQKLPVQAGWETMLGKTVSVTSRIDAAGGKVFVEGETWNAVSDAPIEAGQPAEIVSLDGLTLKVKPKS